MEHNKQCRDLSLVVVEGEGPSLLGRDWLAFHELSELFRQFVEKKGIRHLKSALYHPATNGLAERTVQTLKSALKKAGNGPLETKMSRFLFHYRLTPHSTGISPVELLIGRCPRSHLDQILPDVRQ